MEPRTSQPSRVRRQPLGGCGRMPPAVLTTAFVTGTPERPLPRYPRRHHQAHDGGGGRPEKRQVGTGHGRAGGRTMC